MARQNSKVLDIKEKGNIISHENIKNKILEIRSQQVLLDSDVALIYGVETRRLNEAVKNNKDKFPRSYMFTLNKMETNNLRSKFSTANDAERSTANISSKRRTPPKVFTEKGLYMLATILKSKNAIIETFAKVRELKREIKEQHIETDVKKQSQKMKRFGELLGDIVSPDLETAETESSLELDFFCRKNQTYSEENQKAQ